LHVSSSHLFTDSTSFRCSFSQWAIPVKLCNLVICILNDCHLHQFVGLIQNGFVIPCQVHIVNELRLQARSQCVSLPLGYLAYYAQASWFFWRSVALFPKPRFRRLLLPLAASWFLTNWRENLLHIYLNSSSCHNVFILHSLSDLTNLSLLASVCAACMLAYRCLQMKWCAVMTVVAIPSQIALLMCPYISSGKILSLAPRCSCTLLHKLQPTSESPFDFCKPLGYQDDPCNCHHFEPFKFPSDAWVVPTLPQKPWSLLSIYRMIGVSCSALARTHDFKIFLSSIQVFCCCCNTCTMLWCDVSYRFLCVQSSMSSPLHYLSCRRLSVLICI